MQKRKFIYTSILMLVLSIFVAFFALVPVNSVKSLKTNAWMSEIDDDYKIKELSIPGTHDSGAMHSIFDVSGKCQDMDIEAQLNIGVRFFDLRLQLVNDEFKVVHSFVDQKLKFSSVIEDINKFMDNNPSEFLILSIKKEEESKNSTLSFEEALLRDLEGSSRVVFDDCLPETIKDARGKIYIMSRFQTSIGIKAYEGWEDSKSFELGDFYIQDNYCITDIDTKINDIKNAHKYAIENNKILINFTSCYLDNLIFPPTYAATPAIKINKWAKEYYETNFELPHYGIVVMDFITYELANNIIWRNLYEAY